MRTTYSFSDCDALAVSVRSCGFMEVNRAGSALEFLRISEVDVLSWCGCGKSTASEIVEAIKDSVPSGLWDNEFALHGEVVIDAANT